MENEQLCWSKTLLNAYSYLETICNAIDKTVLNYGVNSAYAINDTISIANKIISLTERKKFLINVKVLIDEILEKLPIEYARILIVRYVDKVKTDLASEVLGLAQRTFFRKSKTAVELFAAELLKEGYDIPTLHSTFYNENWIIEILNGYLKKGDKSVEANELALMQMAFRSITKNNIYYNAY